MGECPCRGLIDHEMNAQDNSPKHLPVSYAEWVQQGNDFTRAMTAGHHWEMGGENRWAGPCARTLQASGDVIANEDGAPGAAPLASTFAERNAAAVVHAFPCGRWSIFRS
jgi:hypothetical protein